jgi:hypothetical protein
LQSAGFEQHLLAPRFRQAFQLGLSIQCQIGIASDIVGIGHDKLL